MSSYTVNAPHLYFHSSCFDGIVSSVMTADFLEKTQGWTLQGDQLVAVGYDKKSSWLSEDLPIPCAVVDFLYHPQAVFWADHHGTTFLSDAAKQDFERRRGPWLVYDKQSGSCARLLHNHFARCLGFTDPRYNEMVEWADKIDSARYTSVAEAILGDTSALRIRASLAAGEGREFSKQLVEKLRINTLDQVAELSLVKERAREVQSKIAAGLERFASAVKLDEGEIVVFDVTTQKNVMLSRYAPYHFFPEARYSAGVVRSPNSAKITVMRNPWREFPSVDLGKILEKEGGGGHERVASVILSGDRVEQAALVLAQIVHQIREQDALVEVAAG
jgi:hypothetical protein